MTGGGEIAEQGRTPRTLSQTELRAELAKLKRSSPYSYQDLHRLTGRSRTTLHDWITGKHLPVARDNGDFRSLVELLGSPKPDDLLNSIIRLRDRTATSTANPYRGLASFTEQQSAFFFGRDALTAQLIRRASDSIASQSDKPLIVVGASGSGKTSLLRAGLLSALKKRPGYKVRYTTPSRGGFAASDLDPPPGNPDTITRVVVIDQFEEHFSPDNSPDSGGVAAAMSSFCQEPNTLLVIGVRSDFFHRIAEVPLLLAGLQDSPIVVGAMTTEEVTAAITKPADRASIQLAPGLLVELVNQFTNTIGSGTISNSLPLLSHVLHELVEISDQNYLTMDDYLKMGGLEQAIEQSAEKAFATSGISEEACRQLFVQLVDVAQDAQPTRRVARITHPHPHTEAAVKAFASHRLLTTDYDTVSISHEVLLSAWPRLAAWVDDGRAALVAVNRLRSAAKLWDQLGRDSDALLRGGQLSAAVEVAASPNTNTRLAELDHQFLAACRLAATEQEDQEHRQLSRQAASQANLLYDKSPNLSAQIALAAHHRAATTESRSAIFRATSPLPGYRILCGPGPIILATANSATVAFSNPDEPSTQLVELSRAHDHHSRTLPKPDDRPNTTALALTADGSLLAHGSAEGIVHLLDATDPPDDSTPNEPVELDSEAFAFDGPINALLFNHNTDRVFAAGGNDGVAYWDLTNQEAPSLCGMVPTPGTTLSLSIDASGTLLATSNQAGTIALWSLPNPREPRPTRPSPKKSAWQSKSSHHGPAPTVALAPDATLLAAGYHNGQVRIWALGANTSDVNASGDKPSETTEISLEGKPFGSWVNSVCFSPSGHMVAAGSSDGNVRLWDTTTWTQLLNDFLHPTVVTSVQFLNEETLISAAEDGTLRTWDITNALQPHTSESVWSVSYDATGSVRVSASRSIAKVASINTDNTGSAETGWAETEKRFTPQEETEFSGTSAISPNGRLLALGTRSGPIQIEPLPGPGPGKSLDPSPTMLQGLQSLVENLAFSPDGSLLGGVDRDGIVRLWTVDDEPQPLVVGPVGLTGVEPPASDLAFSSDSRLLAVTSESGNTTIFDVSSLTLPSLDASGPDKPKTLTTFRSGDSFALGVDFHPSRRFLAIGNTDQSTRLWDLSEPSDPQPLALLPGATGNTMAVAFNMDGSLLAVGTTSGMVSIWDTSQVAEPVLFARFRSPERGVYALAFSPDKPILTASGPNQSLFHWTIAEGEAIGLIKSAVGDPLTKVERLQHLPGHDGRGL